MWFVKSIQSSESIQIYFDTLDNKHVRRGGTLASRCNNPGLIRSHSNIALSHGSIGHCRQYPVFPNITLGKRALHSWLKLKSYYSEPLIAIAQYQSPEGPDQYLSKLCHLSGLDQKCTPSQLSRKQFDKLVWAIEEIAGAHKTLGDESFEQLPKIIGKFSYCNGTVDYYLIADKRILTKEETLAEVKAEKIDAVVIHRSDGIEYLRSRPGHVLSQINIRTQEPIEAPDFKDLIRESGEQRERQAVWGFINGIFNNQKKAESNLAKMVEAVNGELVWGMVNNTDSTQGFGLPNLFSMEFGIAPEIVNIAVEYINFLFSQAEKESHNPSVIVIAHSEGALIAECAVKQLKPSVRKKIQFWTLGGAGFVPDGVCHPNTCNYINQHDLIARAGSPVDYRLLIVRDKFKDKNLDFVANFLAGEDMLAEGLDMGPVYEHCKQERTKKYRKRLGELSNTKIIYHKREGGVHHGFDDPHYQEKLRELVKELYGNR